MDKFLELKINVGGGAESTPFPNSDNPIIVGAFRYDAKRMGGAPTITASVNYPSCLDDEWTDNVYAEFNGEKYYLKQTPTSSYDNADTMYKHDITLVSERVALDNVYFFDVVTGNPVDSDKPVSNSTKVVFFGDIREFARRMNASLEYSKLLKWEDGVDEEGNPIKVANGYNIVVDNDEAITTEEKLMSFEDQFFSNVLQEIYNTYEVPYYFDGKTIHIGYSKEGVVIPDLAYGVDNALLSITKNNANFKIVNRATGTGSSDNIPFYYPNNSPKGEIAATPSGNFEVKILDVELYSNEIKLDGVIRKSNVEYENAKATFGSEEIYSGETFSAQMGAGGINKMFGIEFTSKDAGIFLFSFSSSVTKYILKEEEKSDATFGIRYFVTVHDRTAKKRTYDSKGSLSSIEDFEVQVPYANHKYEIIIECYYAAEGKYAGKGGQIAFNASYSFGSKSGWMYEDKVVDLKDVGLEVVGNTVTGDTITQTLVKYVNTSKFLMPFKYRETDGKERFYNATNEIYPFKFVDGYELKEGEYVGEDGMVHHPDHYEYKNPFVEGRPKEHIITVEDIKPSIKEMVNSMGLRMDMFSEFAYDLDDNDELVENEEGSEHEYVHSYFFAKLRKLDFNLFDHAIEQQPMTISFTSGDCGACNFEIGVTEEFPQKNPVQVNADGTLKRDEKGRVVCGQFEEITEDECQPQQQDTINNEVWIALKKEDSTYGILMPKAPTKDEQEKEVGGHRPKACSAGKNDGDTFVILGINLPYKYIEHAEKKLEAEIIKYLQENNDEKFTFSIGFSRIFFEENATVLNQLSENSKIRIIYDEKPYDLYVSSFSYNMAEGDALPEIRVELDETLKVSQNALQNAISQVKSELGRALGNIDVLGAATPYFIRKDADDEARGKINFTKGIKFGEGGKVEVLDNNSAKLTIEYLEVTKKASFTSLEIQEKTHVGGQILVTPAAINCGEVEELEDVYRCYFQTKGTDGDEIFNQFAVGDQAICQTYNAWGSVYYWRLVTGIGEDYIDLSKTDCDEDSGIPKAGDKIIQLGNRADVERQNAIVIAAYGDGSPYIIQYKGINNFELPDDKIVTKLSSTENIFTGKVHMRAGSDGLSQLPEWIEVKDKAEEALEKAGSIGEGALAELEEYIDGVRQELQEQIDGAVDSYFENYEPSIYNYPAKDWTTEEKESHLNDTFTNLNDGRSWRWSKAAGVYTWLEIADTATSEALKIAGQAKESADGKIRMFVEQPHPPYSVGDLWSRGEEAPLMRCINAKESGAFDESDWGIADNSQAYTDEAISNIKIGGTNLLRNSGFTGDYLSERLADEKVLEGAAELYSSPLDHWTTTSSVIVLDSTETISGKVANINGGTLSQSLYYNTVVGAEYVLSFKAKGRGNLTYAIGDVVGSVALTADWQDFEVVVTTNAASNAFSLSDTNCTIGNLKLEKGNKASAWSASPLDNASDRAYYQSMKYIQNAFEGATDVFGGLVLTEQIQVGDYDSDKKEWVKMNGGMSGAYESDHDVAFWAGGNFNQAIETVMQYADNPKLQPTEEQLASMAKFVVTHGGKAILNDIILRGIIYANDGEFKGKINIDAPNVDGRVQIDDSGLAYFGKHNDEEYMRVALGGTCQGASLATYAPNAHTAFCTNTTMLAIGDEDTDALHAKGNVWLYDGVVYVDKLSFLSSLSGDHGKIEGTVGFEGDVAFNGKVNGLQETIVISDSNMHRIDSENGASILVNMTSGTAKIALGSTNDGNEVIIESKGASIQLSASKSIYDHYNQAYLSSSINNRGVIRLKYYESAGEWTMTWIAKY